MERVIRVVPSHVCSIYKHANTMVFCREANTRIGSFIVTFLKPGTTD